MRLHRIAHHDYITNLAGLGASYDTGGRWNKAGIPALYFAESAAVAMLEMANYLPSPRLVPASYRMGVFKVPADTSLERLSTQDLPSDWRGYPYPPSTQQRGTDWLLHGQAPLLAIPSAAVPTGLESIVLASPSRLQGTSIRLQAIFADLYNSRAFASAGAGGQRSDT